MREDAPGRMGSPERKVNFAQESGNRQGTAASGRPGKVPRRIAQAVIGSLKGGVVPRIGLPYITVGRRAEIDALLSDTEIVLEGGASFRFIVGRYGSGKSFLLQTIRNNVMDRNFVVADADLSPERKLTGTKGQGLATYRELIGNLATKTRPEGGALSLVLDRWVAQVQMKVTEETGLVPGEEQASGTADEAGAHGGLPFAGAGFSGTASAGRPDGGSAAGGPGADLRRGPFSAEVHRRVRQQVQAVGEMVHGYDFIHLLTMYTDATLDGDDETKAKILRWFRGEYPTKTEARQELGVSAIITDEDWYDYLKLFAQFFVQAGYSGLILFIDELVNIYKIPNSVARNNNYEKILTMYNDALQGKAHYIGTIMSGTPQCVEDTRRGIYSYEALRSRLQQGRFSKEGARDMLAPVIHLDPLTPEEMLVLTEKLSAMHGSLYKYESRISQDERVAFIRLEYDRVGADSHITPREIIRDYIEMLDILLQHPEMKMADLLGDNGNGAFSFSSPDPTGQNESADEDYASFTL